MGEPVRVEKEIGLGDAIRRFVDLEWATRTGTSVIRKQDLEERAMLLEALNVIPLPLGFDCNNDGVPDTVDIFRESVAEGCCSLASARLARLADDTKRRKRRSSSRRKR